MLFLFFLKISKLLGPIYLYPIWHHLITKDKNCDLLDDLFLHGSINSASFCDIVDIMLYALLWNSPPTPPFCVRQFLFFNVFIYLFYYCFIMSVLFYPLQKRLPKLFIITMITSILSSIVTQMQFCCLYVCFLLWALENIYC